MEQQPISKEQTEESPGTLRSALKILAYPIAGLSGFYAASKSVHNSAYSTAKRLGAFDDILKDATPVSKQQIQDRIASKTTVGEFMEKALGSKHGFQNSADARLEHLGLDTFLKKWKYMEKSAKQTAVMEGLTVTGIAIGAMLTMADSKAVHKFFAAHSERSTPEIHPTRG